MDGPPRESLAAIAREWGRIGCIGFGGPPAHIALLRALCVDRRQWLSAQEFEDGVATTNLLPGPASTQLAIYCAWRLRGPLGGAGRRAAISLIALRRGVVSTLLGAAGLGVIAALAGAAVG